MDALINSTNQHGGVVVHTCAAKSRTFERAQGSSDSTCVEWASHWPMKDGYVPLSLLLRKYVSLGKWEARSALLRYAHDANFRDTDKRHYPVKKGVK